VTELVYVTAEDCHFCEHGRAVLDELGVERAEIRADSEEAAALAAQGIPLSFMPVLTDGRRVIAYGRFSAKRLRRELDLR
jgi:glutaredoxin